MKSDEFESKLKLVNMGLINSIEEFLNKPTNFFYEQDIRGFLYGNLYSLFDKDQNLRIEALYDKWLGNASKIQKLFNPVKAEFYPEVGRSAKEYSNKYNISNIDISILSNLTQDATKNYIIPSDIIIEIKLSSEKNDSQHNGFIKDFEKICKYNYQYQKNYVGIAICFDLHEINDVNSFRKKYHEKSIDFIQIILNDLKLVKNTCNAIYVCISPEYINEPKIFHYSRILT